MTVQSLTEQWQWYHVLMLKGLCACEN